MSCPFKHLWPGRAPPHATGGPETKPNAADEAASAEPEAAAAPPAAAPPAAFPVAHGSSHGASPSKTTPASGTEAASCPFGHGTKGGAMESGTPTAGKCPFGHERSGGRGSAVAAGEEAGADRQQPEGQTEPAVCPLGFGRAPQGPRMSALHCVLCRSLFHDCATTSCGHRFCAGCIQRFHDCPLCGADVGATTPDADTQALVEQYIETHGGEPTALWQLEGSVGREPEAPPEGGRAALLLQLGLRALSGRNLPAAEHRFGQCRDALLERLVGHGAGPSDTAAAASAAQRAAAPAGAQPAAAVPGGGEALLRSRLGAVCGCLGDCRRAAGDLLDTAEWYERSAEQLRLAGEEDVEAQQALSVTLNKLGELHHLQGALDQALPLYRQSLAIRRARLAALGRERTAGQASGAGPAAATGAWEGGGGEEGGEWPAAALDMAVGCLKVADALQSLGGAGADADAHLQEAAGLVAQLEGNSENLPAPLRGKLTAVQAHLAGRG